MNNKKKVILSGILSLVLCISMIAGGTFALFTSESSNNIAITSGKVDVTATLEVDHIVSPILLDTYGQTLNGAHNGSAALKATVEADGTLTVTNMIPGDKVFVKVVSNKTNTNVPFKQRTIVKVAEDPNGLYNELLVGIAGNYYADFTSAWESNSALYAAGSDTYSQVISIELPGHVTGDEFEGKTCKIAVTVEAVQGNADVTTTENLSVVHMVENQDDLDAAVAAIVAEGEDSNDTIYVSKVVNSLDLNYSGTDEATFALRGFQIGTLNVNAPNGNVYVRNNVKTINVEAVAMNSLHVFGKVENLNIKQGHIVIENKAVVDVANINADNTVNFIIAEQETDASVIGQVAKIVVAKTTADVNIRYPEGTKVEIEDKNDDDNKANTAPSTVDTQEALQKAIENSFAGEVISLDGDITLTSPILTLGKHFTIAGNGKTITFNTYAFNGKTTSNLNGIAPNTNMTVNNVRFVNTAVGTGFAVVLGTNPDDSNGASVKLNGCTFEKMWSAVYGGALNADSKASFAITNCTYVQTNYTYSIETPNTGNWGDYKVTFENNNTAGKGPEWFGEAIIVHADGSIAACDTLAQAVTRAKVGDVITLLKDITLSAPIATNGETFAIDGNGKKITFNQYAFSSKVGSTLNGIAANTNMTISNVHFVNTAPDTGFAVVFGTNPVDSNGASATLENCTFENMWSAVYGGSLNKDSKASFAIKNCTYINTKYSYSIEAPTHGNLGAYKVTFADNTIDADVTSEIFGDAMIVYADGYIATCDTIAQAIDRASVGNAELNGDVIILDQNFAAVTADMYEKNAKVLLINSKKDMYAFANAVNSGTTTFDGVTVKLTADITFADDEAWTPIGNVNSYPSVTFAGIFDGQGHTISNMKASASGDNGYAAAGLFGSITGVVKNVNIDNATVTSTHYAGGVVGFSSANVGMKIENCKVTNSTITTAPEQLANGTWDNGDKAGGIIGYMVAGDVVTGCTVENITVTGYRDLGGIVGHAAGTVSNCTALMNVEIVIDNSHNYNNYTTDAEHDANVIVGEAADGIILSNNTPKQVKAIKTAAELKVFLNNFGAAGSGSNIINIEADINLNAGEIWTPVKIDGYHGADVIIINGNGHKITGLTAPLFSGGFAGGSGIVINDLTIADSKIVSTNTLGSGAFIETVDSMDVIKLINCHLDNSTVTGSRTGGLIGWNSGYNNTNDGAVKTYVTIENCSVTDCEITGAGTVGGIVGHAGANAWTFNTITNCKVENTKLTSNDDSYRVGAIVGTANVGEVTITGCTSTGNTILQNNNGTEIARPEGQSELYGRFVPQNGSGSLTIDGKEIK